MQLQARGLGAVPKIFARLCQELTCMCPPCFVSAGFYGGVAGLIPSKDMDLLPGQQAADVYSVGQLLRVQV